MTKQQRIRFASGRPEAPFSGVWRLIVNKDDVYLGPSKDLVRVFKISLHKSGVWVLAATQQSGVTLKNGNRRGMQWKRPLEHTRGVTRGPSILVPHTSLGSRPPNPDDGGKDVGWFPGPTSGKVVEFSMYFVEPNTPTTWDPDQPVMGECSLARGNRLVLLASMRPGPAAFMETVERLLRENVFRMKDPNEFAGGSLLWFTESPDALRVPMAVDLPVPIGPLPTNAD